MSEPIIGRLPLIALHLTSWIASAASPPLAGPGTHAAQAALVTLIAGVPCILLGAAFPIGFRVIAGALLPRDADERTSIVGTAAGLSSAATTAGNMTGMPVAYLLLSTPAGSREILVGCAVVLALACIPTAPSGFLRRLAVAGLAASGGLLLLPGWDPAVVSSGPFLYGALYRAAAAGGERTALSDALRARGPVIYSSDGPHALVTVRRHEEGLLSLQVNGKTDASTGGDMKTQTLTSMLPMLWYEAARASPAARALIVGMGSGVSAGAALAHPLTALDVVEISPEVVRAARHFSAANHDALEDPRIRVVVEDARSWLLFGGARYDVIASQPSNPWISGEASLFTREFFSLARSRLNPGGIMCQWLQGHGLAAADFRSVVATFTSVFPHASLWEESTAGGDYLLLGSDSPLDIRTKDLRGGMRRQAVASDLARIEIRDLSQLLSLHVASGHELRKFSQDAPVQTEDRLSLEFSALSGLNRDTLGEILAGLEPHREDNALRWPDDHALSRDLRRQAREARRERDWAAGLGLLQSHASDGDIHRVISWIRAGMRNRAYEAAGRIARDRPGERLPHMLHAHLAMSLGDTDIAVRALVDALAVSHGDARIRLYLSRALFAAGNVAEALSHNTEVIRLDPTMAEASNDRCAMLLQWDDPASAEAACRDALAFDPEMAEAHANLGVVHSRRARWDAAIESYLRALAIDPDLDDARYNLAALHEREQRGAEGLAVLAPLLDPSYGDPSALRLGVRLAILTGNLDQATLWLEESLRIEPDNEESLALAGKLGR